MAPYPNEMVPLQIDLAIGSGRYLVHGGLTPLSPEANERADTAAGGTNVWSVSSGVRGPTRPTTRELEAIRADLVTQATGANVSIRRDHAIAIVNELLELRELTETTGRALRQLGGIARDADAPRWPFWRLSSCDCDVRHLVPCPAVEGAPTCLRRAASPLLEEERDAGRSAAVTDLRDPRELQGRAEGPDSPPAMTHPMPARSISPNGPRSGSPDRNRTAAGTVRMAWTVMPAARPGVGVGVMVASRRSRRRRPG